MSYVKTIEELQLDGGIPCLDLVNSSVDVETDVVIERLHNYNDLLTLARRSGLLEANVIRSLKELASASPAEAEAVVARMRDIRRDMYLVFLALATGKLRQLDPQVLERFNKAVHWAGSVRRFGISKQQLLHEPDATSSGLSLPLRAFILSAEDLLLHHDQQLVKKCATCAWLFLDRSKSHRRKWCDMQSCGSMAKSKRYYKRKTKG